MAMNLTGLETFGDALGPIPNGSDFYYLTETFTLNSGMFVNSFAGSNGLFSANLASLAGGPAYGISQSNDSPFVPGNTYRMAVSNLPAGVAADAIAYLGRLGTGSNGNFDVTASQGLVDYAKANGIDPSQLALDPTNSYVEFVYPTSGSYLHASDFIGGSIAYQYFAEYRVPALPEVIYGLTRQKVTENMTPVPTDRIIFDYSYFHNVPLAYRDIPVQRFTPGFEKTFFKKNCSVEMRFPFAATIDNTLYSNNANEISVVRWGDMTVILKWLALKRNNFAMTLGLGISLPIAEGTNLIDAYTGREVIRSNHESVHLMPYFGLLYLPNDRVFLQAYFQVDAAANGDPTYVADMASDAAKMNFAGKVYDRTYAYTALSVGYWMARKFNVDGSIKRGMNLIGELHWTQSLDGARGIRYQQDNYVFDIGNVRDNYSVLDLTVGTRFQFNTKTNIGVGYSVPLSGDCRQFDGELRLTCNRYF